MLWIVGKSLSEFRNYLDHIGVLYGIFWDISLPLPDDVACPIVHVDYKNLASLEDQLSSIKDIQVSSVIVAGYENYVLPAAIIARHFNVPGPSIEAAIAATDKAVMRQRFIDFDPSLTPDFIEADSFESVKRFMETHSFPVMLKPASLMKSLLITKNNSMEELDKNFHETQNEIVRLYAKYSIGSTPKIILEEFLEGSMHTVAAFSDSEGNPMIIPGIVDCITGQQAGYDDNFLYSRTLPSQLSTDQQQSVVRTAIQGMKALGLKSCPAHIEIIVTDNGPKIVEIGARIGGYRPRMYKYAEGIDLQKIMLEIANGRPAEVDPNLRKFIAVYELFPDKKGIFESLSEANELQKLPSLRHYSVKAERGDLVGKSSQGYKAAAVLILGNEDEEQFNIDTEFVRKNARILLSGQ